MINRKVNITLIICLLVPVNIKANDTKEDSKLHIYLPREITAKENCLTIGQVSVIRGQEYLVNKANKIALGQISAPGQRIVINRTMLLSRLACNGIPASKVTLTGAKKITVKQQERIISSDELVKLANSFLERNPPNLSVCEFNPIRIPKDFIIVGMGKDIKFSPRLIQNKATNRAIVEITILSENKKIGSRQIIFGLKHNRRQAITTVDIPAGAVISTENVRIVKTISNYPEPADWRPPYGLVTYRRIPANTVLRQHMSGPAKPPIAAKRNQKVVIRIERPGILITAIGKAMQDGRVGECIKVRNEDSQRIILARVNENGSVEPVF